MAQWAGIKRPSERGRKKTNKFRISSIELEPEINYCRLRRLRVCVRRVQTIAPSSTPKTTRGADAADDAEPVAVVAAGGDDDDDK